MASERYLSKDQIILSDLKYIDKDFENKIHLNQSTILITGCAGFLGYYFLQYFLRYGSTIGINKVIGVDNFLIGRPKWLSEMEEKYKFFELHDFNIIKDDLDQIISSNEADYILHMASIASPTFYRKYPIETLDANIWGLRKLLEFYKDKDIKGFLMFSSSEVYGDPSKDSIPTEEIYRGNVSTIGPRACYDEAKRFSETICYLFAQEYQMPITMVRPFNNYGPGMKINDKRVPADFAKAIIENKNINIFSDGNPTRTFCYISDAITGYLKALTYGKFDIFNIGTEKPEISIRNLAEIYKSHGINYFNYSGEITFLESNDSDYMTDNPNRRCPSIKKAKRLLNYSPRINIDDGIFRFLNFLKDY